MHQKLCLEQTFVILENVHQTYTLTNGRLFAPPLLLVSAEGTSQQTFELLGPRNAMYLEFGLTSD